MNNATIGAAVLGGYLLGRTKKAKLALGLGGLLAGSRVRPGQLGKALDAPFLGDLTKQVRTELADASKAAATSVLTSKAESLAGTLHERTAELRERAEGNGEPDDAEAEAEAEDQDQDQDQENDQAEEDEETGGEDEETVEEDEEAGGEDEEEGADEDAKAETSRKRPAKKTGAGTTARRSGGGRSTTQPGRSTAGKSAPRPAKKSAAASRAKSGSGSRSRRQDDG